MVFSPNLMHTHLSIFSYSLDQLSRNGSGYSRWVELAVAAGIIIISGDNILLSPGCQDAGLETAGSELPKSFVS